MLKDLISKLFRGKESAKDSYYVIASINEKIQPIDRGAVYEDPLTEFLQNRNLGEVTGGGTMQLETGELEYCDLEIELKALPNETIIHQITIELERLGAPKGSTILIESTGEKIPFGRTEGIAGVSRRGEPARECL